MRSYTVALSALAIDAPAKWVDNLLSQHVVEEVVPQNRRGLARRISHLALVRLAVIRQLNHALGMSVADAVRVAGLLLAPEGADVYRRGQMSLTLDRAALECELAARLGDALESAPSPRRGRPSRRDAQL